MNRPPLPRREFEAISAKVPRLTVELILAGPSGIWLTQRTEGSCGGLWHLPGGTVRFGEPFVEAVGRVGADELGVEVVAETLLGIIEYPSHLDAGIDWPVGLAVSCRLGGPEPVTTPHSQRFGLLPLELHDEQRAFLLDHHLAR